MEARGNCAAAASGFTSRRRLSTSSPRLWSSVRAPCRKLRSTSVSGRTRSSTKRTCRSSSGRSEVRSATRRRSRPSSVPSTRSATPSAARRRVSRRQGRHHARARRARAGLFQRRATSRCVRARTSSAAIQPPTSGWMRAGSRAGTRASSSVARRRWWRMPEARTARGSKDAASNRRRR